MRFLLALILLSTPAWAQDGIRASDQILDRAAMSDLLSGHIVEFHDGSKSSYAPDGTYGYTYTDDGPVWSGQYEVQSDSRVCVNFDNGSRRCDQFVKDGERVILVTEDGLRFPIRNRIVYQR